MSMQERRDSRLAAVLLEVSPEGLIAACRLAVTLFAFLTVWSDIETGPLDAPTINFILSAFLTYAITLAIFVRIVTPDFGIQVTIHFLDIVMLAVLMHFIEGPTDDFTLFVLGLLFAALRWSWMGVMITIGGLVALILGIAAVMTEEGADPRRLASHGMYLVLAGVILAYLAALREHARWRIAKLATWPVESVSESEFPRMEETLSHALSVAGGRRAAVLWEEGDEPYTNSVLLDCEGMHSARRPPSAVPLIEPELADTTFILLDQKQRVVRTAEGTWVHRAAPVNPALAAELSISTALVAPVATAHAKGHILVLDVNCSLDGMLPLAEIVASRMAALIEHHILDRKLAADAAAKERSQMGRDLHDGTLQAMTAIALHLQAMLPKASKQLRPRIAELQDLIREQQRALRDYLAIPRERLPWEFSLEPQMAYTLREVEEMWGCGGTYDVTPRDARVSLTMGDQLNFLIKEAAANAVRHGGANRIDVTASVGETALTLVVRDNGHGIVGADRSEDGELLQRTGPRSLSNRVQELGGSITTASTLGGFELTIELPL